MSRGRWLELFFWSALALLAALSVNDLWMRHHPLKTENTSEPAKVSTGRYAVVRRDTGDSVLEDVIQTESPEACEEALKKLVQPDKPAVYSGCVGDNGVYQKIFDHAPVKVWYVLWKAQGQEKRATLIKKKKGAAPVSGALDFQQLLKRTLVPGADSKQYQVVAPAADEENNR